MGLTTYTNRFMYPDLIYMMYFGLTATGPTIHPGTGATTLPITLTGALTRYTGTGQTCTHTLIPGTAITMST